MQKCLILIDSYLRERKFSTHFESNDQETAATNYSSARHSNKRSDVIDMLIDPNSAKGHSPLGKSALVDEVIMLLSAGNDTASDAMYIGIYQVCKSGHAQKKLAQELSCAFTSG